MKHLLIPFALLLAAALLLAVTFTLALDSGGSVRVMADIPSLEAGETAEIDVDPDTSRAIGVSSVQITAARATSGATVRIEKLSKSSAAAPPSETVFSYLEIEVEGLSEDDLREVTIDFAVPTVWLENNGMDEEHVVLFRLVEQDWTALNTRPMGRSEGSVSYQAISPGLSQFAVGAVQSLQAVSKPFFKAAGTSTPNSNTPETSVPVVNSGDTFLGWYQVENPGDYAMTVWLGLSIFSPSGEEIVDEPNDKTVSVPPGISSHARSFQVPSDSVAGKYDAVLCIWPDAFQTEPFDCQELKAAVGVATDRPGSCQEFDGRGVCFEHYLHNSDGYRLDPVNVIFIGENIDAHSIAMEIEERLGWEGTGGTTISLVIDGSPREQNGQRRYWYSSWHIRLFEAGSGVVLAAVHNDESDCFIALHVGDRFDAARNEVLGAFEDDFQWETLPLQNTLPTQQCFDSQETQSQDGLAIIVWLNRPKGAAAEPSSGGRPVCYGLSRSVHGGSGGTPPSASSPTCPGGEYEYGEVVTLTASPAPGWHVAHWHGTNNNGSTSTSDSVTMTSNKSVSVHYEQDEQPVCHGLSRSVHGGSGGTPSASSPNCSGGEYEDGKVVTLTASPAPGWHVAHWHGTNNNGSTSTSNSVTMNADRSVSVHYEQDEQISYSLSRSVHGGSGGTPSASSPNEPGGYTPGTVVNLTASPASGWRVAHWHGTNSNGSTSISNTVTMTSNKSVSVHYEQDEPVCHGLSLSVHGGSGGVPTASSSNCFEFPLPDPRYVPGTVVNLTASPASGWRVAHWHGTNNNGSTSISNTVTMNGDGSVSVHYDQPPVPTPTGTISVNRGKGANYEIGDPLTICFTVNQLALTRIAYIEGATGDLFVISTDDHLNLGHCHTYTVGPPPGNDTIRLQYRSGSNWVTLDETWIRVKSAEPTIVTGTISVDRGKGGIYEIGDPLTICFTVNQLALTRIAYIEGATGDLFVISTDDHHNLGHCHTYTVGPPPGVDTIRLQYWNGSTWVYLDETWIWNTHL